MKYSFLFGQKFGLLTVIDYSGNRDRLLCRCDCGSQKIARLSHLRSGSVKSCGCLLKTTPKRVHGKHMMGHTRTYAVWNSMVLRCTSHNSQAFKSYGARGIEVCERWLGQNGFLNFFADMGEKPNNQSIDRIDNNKGYYKENCRWADSITQSNNKRSNVNLTAMGETFTLAQWSRKIGVGQNTISERLRRGWSVHDAITRPVRGKSSQ